MVVILSAWSLAACQAGLSSDGEPERGVVMGEDAGGRRAAEGAAGRAGVSGMDGAIAALPREAAAGDGAPALPADAAAPVAPGRVVISEIQYHPTKELSATDEHEFIELANRTREPVPVGDWRLVASGEGGFGFSIPAGTTIAPGGFLVMAKNPAKVGALYGISSVLGPLPGELDNGGARVTLFDEKGIVVDDVRYDDESPWPIGADGMGMGEDYLKALQLEVSTKTYVGRSLERVSYDVPGNEPANWVASPVDRPSPGKPNSITGEPGAIVDALQIEPQADPARGLIIKRTDRVVLRVKLSARGTAIEPRVELFVDDIEKTGEATMTVPLAPARDGFIEAVLPPQPDRAIVRYRIMARRRAGGPVDVIAPRSGDPLPNYAYFVTPDTPGETPIYHLFIARERWNRLFSNIKWVGTFLPGGILDGGRMMPSMEDPTGCKLNPTWNGREPAVLVWNGQVVDILARYQGSPSNRGVGPGMNDSWPPEARPASPSPFRALSWRFYIPRYTSLDGKSDIIVNKLATMACQAFSTYVGGKLFEAVGIPASQVWYRRLYINGRYYHYMAEYERVGEEMLQRFFGKRHPVGDLFKSAGFFTDRGPYGYGDGRDLPPFCGYSREQRFRHTYERVTPRWKDEAMLGSPEMVQLSRELMAARPGGIADVRASRAFFEKNFDVPLLTNYIAVMNWMYPWDDFYQNWLLYKRTDGKWMFVPWDLDRLMGGFSPDDPYSQAISYGTVPPALATFYAGEVGDPGNRNRRINQLKDSFIKAFRDELHQRWKELVAGPLSPANVARIVDEARALFKAAEAQMAPAVGDAFCAYDSTTMTTDARRAADTYAGRMKAFARDRAARVAQSKWRHAEP